MTTDNTIASAKIHRKPKSPLDHYVINLFYDVDIEPDSEDCRPVVVKCSQNLLNMDSDAVTDLLEQRIYSHAGFRWLTDNEECFWRGEAMFSLDTQEEIDKMKKELSLFIEI